MKNEIPKEKYFVAYGNNGEVGDNFGEDMLFIQHFEPYEKEEKLKSAIKLAKKYSHEYVEVCIYAFIGSYSNGKEVIPGTAGD